MAERDRPSFFAKLRRTARSAQASVQGKVTLDHNAVWQAHERAVERTRDAGESAQRVSAIIARHRTTVDAATERLRALGDRADAVADGFARVVESFERLSLVALNSGLEGARLGEPSGRALLLVGDEVRGHASRGEESSKQTQTALREFARDASDIATDLVAARELSQELALDAARTMSAMAETERALADLTDRIRRATGSDPETVRAIADATEHARALVTALGTLSGKVPRSLLVAALRPVLEPIARLLADDDGDGDGDEAAR
ncbi:MAG: methyl-accepting chemotaxis protein [Polyangiaceae bacterium]